MAIDRGTGWKIARAIPGAHDKLWFRKPAIFCHDRFLTKVHDTEAAMLLQVGSLEMRDMMLQAEPGLFYITDHYRNFPFVLMRLSAATARSLKDMLTARAAQLAQMKPVKRPAKKAKAPAKRPAKKKAR